MKWVMLLIVFLVLCLVQLTQAWANLFNAVATVHAMKPAPIVVSHHNLLDTFVFLFFFSYYILMDIRELWKKLECNIDLWKQIIGYAFLVGLLGVTIPQNLCVASLSYLDAQFASQLANCTLVIVNSVALPAFVYRDEIAALRRRLPGGKLGLLVVDVFGLFLWGCAILVSATCQGRVLFRTPHLQVAPLVNQSYTHQIRGVLLSLAASVSTTISLILQAKMYEKYPYYFVNLALVKLMGVIQATAYALCVDHSLQSWKLDFNLRLLGFAYSGVGFTGIMMGATALCMQQIGHELPSGFNPVLLIIATVGGPVISDGNFHVGSVLTALLMICGCCAIIWAGIRKKAQQEMNNGSTGDIEFGVSLDNESIRQERTTTVQSPN